LLKKIYLKSFGVVHSYFKTLAETPPEGYRFTYKDYFGRIVRRRGEKRFVENWMKPIMRNFHLPDKLLGSFATYLDAPDAGCNLTITNGLLSFRHEPWIPVVFDPISSLIGHPFDLRFTHPLIENTLARDDCKAIIYFFEATKRSLESTYDISRFESKLEYVPLGVPLVPRKPRPSKKSVNIIFVGSVNFAQDGFQDVWFYNRGGHMVVKAFLRLCTEFDNITLTIRSQLPSDYRRILELNRRVTIIDYPLSQHDFDDLLWESDIYLLPMRDTPWGSFLDAMNHELPIVTTHTYANSEIVQDGKWGIVCEVPPLFRSIVDNYYVRDRDYFRKSWNAWVRDDKVIVDRIVEGLRTLIRDADLRIQLGIAGRKMIEPNGPFSVERRNRYLKQVLDKATN
jgi:glycosyltransferase involved in cell wall biosynthesis